MTLGSTAVKVQAQRYAFVGDTMKLNENFVIHSTQQETLLVPTAKAPFHGLVQANSTVAFILNCLREETTEEGIVEAMRREFRGDIAVMHKDAADVLAQLRQIGAVDE